MIKDKLNIADQQNADFGLMIGVSIDRQKEIAKILDEMVKLPKEASLVYASSIIKYLEERLDSKEELIYALMNHMYWQLANSNVLPQSLADEYKKQYPINDLK